MLDDDRPGNTDASDPADRWGWPEADLVDVPATLSPPVSREDADSDPFPP